MTLIIIGALSALYCGFWFVRGLDGRSIPDNMLRMINRRDERYKVMIGAYGLGLIISAGLIVYGL